MITGLVWFSIANMLLSLFFLAGSFMTTKEPKIFNRMGYSSGHMMISLITFIVVVVISAKF